MGKMSSFSVLLTENCNLSCKYCYEVVSTGHKKNAMTVETATRAVEFMFEHASTERSISVSLFGGEPTLMPDIIDTICTKGKELARKTGKAFNVGMITNATIMNKKLYNIISKHLDIWSSNQLSVDGPWDIQDMYRVTKSGGGSFAMIEKNYPYWKALFGNTLNVHGVLAKHSIPHLFESYKYFREVWGEDALWFMPAKSIEYTMEDIEIYDEQLGKIKDYIMERVRKTGSVKEIDFYAPLDRALRNGKPDKPCGAGDGYGVITAKGDIWPCHHFYFVDEDKQLFMGDIWNGINESKKRIWDEYDNTDMIGCGDCDHNFCYRCVAENFEANGSPFAQIKDFHCLFMKIDKKYQDMIREELFEMGLIQDKNVNENNPQKGCEGFVRDCVGKEGECPVVTKVSECKFDREKEADANTYVRGNIPFDEVADGDFRQEPETDAKCCADSCDAGDDGCQCVDAADDGEGVVEDVVNENSKLKALLDDIIAVLVKHHNEL